MICCDVSRVLGDVASSRCDVTSFWCDVVSFWCDVMSSVYDVMLTVYYVKSPDSDVPVSCIERPPAVLVYAYNVLILSENKRACSIIILYLWLESDVKYLIYYDFIGPMGSLIALNNNDDLWISLLHYGHSVTTHNWAFCFHSCVHL